MSKNKEPYYPNNWEAIAKTPSDFFQECSWKAFKEYKLHSWELPSSVCCLVRVRNTKTSKVKEFVYQRPAAAERKIEDLYQDPNNQIIVAEHERVYMLSQSPFAWPTEESDEDD